MIAPGGRHEGAEYGHGGWTTPYRNPAGAAAVAEARGRGFDLLLGRRTYDLRAGFWPKAGTSPMAISLNAATTYVVTHRPESLARGPVGDLGADVLAGVCALKAQDGPDLVVRGRAAVTALRLEHGLVDEVVPGVDPVLLGRGLRAFTDHVDPRELALVRTTSTPTGVLVSTYRCVGALQPPPAPA